MLFDDCLFLHHLTFPGLEHETAYLKAFPNIIRWTSVWILPGHIPQHTEVNDMNKCFRCSSLRVHCPPWCHSGTHLPVFTVLTHSTSAFDLFLIYLFLVIYLVIGTILCKCSKPVLVHVLHNGAQRSPQESWDGWSFSTVSRLMFAWYLSIGPFYSI